MKPAVVMTFVLTCAILWGACIWGVTISCDSCGSECTPACGTRHFRTCCFNYLRKRTSNDPSDHGPGLKLELWRASPRESVSLRFLQELNAMRELGLVKEHQSWIHNNSVDPDLKLQLIYGV